MTKNIVKAEHITRRKNVITGYFILSDKSRTHFRIERDNGWQQWGNSKENLGLTVGRVEQLESELYGLRNI